MINSRSAERWLWDALLESGASVTTLDAFDDRADVALSVTDDSGTHHTVRLRIKEFSVLRPSTVSGPLATLSPVLVVTDKVSLDAAKALQHSQHSWVSHRPLPSGLRGELRIGDQVVDLRVAPDVKAAATSPARGRPGSAAPLILQELLWRAAATQQDLTSATGISQARVSQVLTKLATAPWLTAGGGRPVRWSVTDPGGLIDHWMATYRPAPSVATYWYSLDTPGVQVQKALQSLGPKAWVSGAMAADVLAPWSIPHSALIHTRSTQGLAEAGFVSSQAGEASLQLVVTKEAAITPSKSARQVINRLAPTDPGLSIADPLVVLWDLSRSDDVDADQAGAHLRSVLIAHLTGRHVH